MNSHFSVFLDRITIQNNSGAQIPNKPESTLKNKTWGLKSVCGSNSLSSFYFILEQNFPLKDPREQDKYLEGWGRLRGTKKAVVVNAKTIVNQAA